MEIKLDGGEYAAGKYSGLARVTGDEETAQRIAMKLTARRGGFAPLPDYGSRLYALGAVKPGQREAAARQYIAEALSGETGVALTELAMDELDGALTLKLTFAAGDGSVEVETVFDEVNG